MKKQKTLKRMYQNQIEAINAEFTRAGTCPEFNILAEKYGSMTARIELPLGELTNEKIAGYLLAWKMRGMITTGPILNSDCFNAQGLEGKFSVLTDVLTAILVWREVPQYRIQVFA